MEPLENWDEAYIQSIATEPETVQFEKKGAAKLDLKASKSVALDELEKQVCAFANAGGGFLVYGIEKNKTIGPGVADEKAWVEQVIPERLQPPLTTCRAKFIPITSLADGRGVLVVSIPSSDLRPHWIKRLIKGVNKAYIRAGEHSAEMSLQTLMDISTRGVTQVGEIVSLGREEGPNRQENAKWIFRINPIVEIQSGPYCEHWCVVLTATNKDVRFLTWESLAFHEDMQIYGNRAVVRGQHPLFPKAPQTIAPRSFPMSGLDFDLEVSLSLGSSDPVVRVFPWQEIFNVQEGARNSSAPNPETGRRNPRR